MKITLTPFRNYVPVYLSTNAYIHYECTSSQYTNIRIQFSLQFFPFSLYGQCDVRVKRKPLQVNERTMATAQLYRAGCIVEGVRIVLLCAIPCIFVESGTIPDNYKISSALYVCTYKN